MSGDSGSQGRIRAGDLSLFWRKWRPDGPPGAAIVLLHGVGEHSGRYERLAVRLVGGGVLVVGFDQRGHGRSEGDRAHVARWRDYEEDALRMLAFTRTSEPGLPVYVFGHSLGALIALTLAIRLAPPGRRSGAGPRGWVVSGAGIRPTGVARPHLVLAARLLSRIAPRVRLDLGIAAETLSHDPDVVRAYREDPMIERRATVRWGREALGAIGRIEREAATIRDPMLIVHGGADPLADAAGSRWLASTVRGPRQLVIYPGALHEPHNDPDHADVGADVLAWLAGTGSQEDPGGSPSGPARGGGRHA